MSAWSRRTCAECGAALPKQPGRGRPRDYCDADCSNDARARRRREQRRELLEELHRYRAAAAQVVTP